MCSKALALAALLNLSATYAFADPMRFTFGSGDPRPPYTSERGSGFEPMPGATPDSAFYFSVAVPEGNYRVTVLLGDETREARTTVKAELRRLMVENAITAPGQILRKTFLVNVRTPEIAGGGAVNLKEREKTTETWAWDDRLTLEFNGSHPAVREISIEPVNDVPTVFIAGDSTSTDQPREPFNSWGQMITRFFDDKVVVANHGESGESLRSFLGENRFAKILSVIRPGDYLFIQMGHNDQKDKLPGAGAFTSYSAFLKQMIAGVREHSAIPVLLTPVQRLTFDPEGRITNSLGDFPDAVRRVAREEEVTLIDLNAMSKTLYEAIGPAHGPEAFAPGDATHHNNYGSYELARCVVEGIRKSKLELRKDLARDVPQFDPAHPDSREDFAVPASPSSSSLKPYGN